MIDFCWELLREPCNPLIILCKSYIDLSLLPWRCRHLSEPRKSWSASLCVCVFLIYSLCSWHPPAKQTRGRRICIWYDTSNNNGESKLFILIINLWLRLIQTSKPKSSISFNFPSLSFLSFQCILWSTHNYIGCNVIIDLQSGSKEKHWGEKSNHFPLCDRQTWKSTQDLCETLGWPL